MQRSDFFIKLISIIILAAMVLYVGLRALDSLRQPIQTVEVSRATVETGSSVSGWAVREENVVYGGGSTVSVQVDDGQRVSAGGLLAMEYSGTSAMERATRLRELKLRLQRLESIREGTTNNQAGAWTSLIALSRAVNSRDLTELDSIELDVETYIHTGGGTAAAESEIASIRSEISQLEYQGGSDTRTITAGEAGIFSSVVDGFESVSSADLEGLSPSGLRSLFAQPEEVSPAALGKLVTDITWYYATVMREADAQRLRSVVGDEDTGAISSEKEITVAFTRTYKATLSMKVESIGQAEDGKCVVVFSCRRGLEDAVGERALTAEVVFESRTGLRIPYEALHDEDGETVVYIVTGLQAERVPVEVLGEYDGYVLVRDGAETGGHLRQGSELIVRGKDLYDGKVVSR